MKKSMVFIALLISTVCLAQPSERTLKVVSFSGSGYDLGVQHGKELKTEIANILEAWKVNTSKALGMDAEVALRDFYKYADFEGTIKKWTPELYEEVRGIAAGSGQDFNDILILNLLDEFWVYINNIKNHHCSSIGVPATKTTPGYLAQNMDLEAYTDGFQILMRLEKTSDRPEQLILTYPGLIGLNGINEKGFAVVVNTLMQLRASANGLPVAFVIRRLINATDKKDILKFIQTVPHASGQNYILGINGEIVDFEASANKVARYDPQNPNGIVYHTNHPIANDDIKPWFKKNSASGKSNSNIRFNALENRLAKPANLSSAQIMETLRSKDDALNPVCRPNNGGGFTFASVIMTMGKEPNLLITAGPPDESEFQKFDFKDKNE